MTYTSAKKTGFDANDALLLAEKKGLLSQGAVANIRDWLTEPRYAEYVTQITERMAAGKWKELDDAFWTTIPFGTGGRRGRMYPIGSNTINDRTIGESAQGLADYVKRANTSTDLSCAIAYDTRHQSRHFAELCAEVMAAAGFKVYFLDGVRSTPELSFAVRYKKASCGIVITASHNPPSDNAVKAYWSTGAQLLPPHDQGVIECVLATKTIQRMPFAEALAKKRVVNCETEVDAAYVAAVHAVSFPGPRDLKILYSPLHGVGASSVVPVLAADGFHDLEVFAPHASCDGDFPDIPNHTANPEIVAVYDSIIARGRTIGADLILASDPDGDRIGLAAPLTSDPAGPWRTMTGNQAGALLTHYLLERWKETGRLTPEHYIVKTVVTSELARRIATAFGVRTYGDYQVGFKYIAQAIDEYGPERFVLGTEESDGYLAGTYARDKDAAVAAMLLAQIAALAKAKAQTLHHKLDELYRQYGYHAESQFSVKMPGSKGMEEMKTLMTRLRKAPPLALAGMKVVRIRDFASLIECEIGGIPRPFTGHKGDLVMLDLEVEGTYVAIRPSGTEPKVKVYIFTYERADQFGDLEGTKAKHALVHSALAGELGSVCALESVRKSL